MCKIKNLKMKKNLFILLIVLNAKMYSTIIVTSINMGFSNNPCNIDLDINGIDDFSIFRPAFNTIDVGCQHSNAFLQVNGGGNAIAYINNATIGASTWSNTSGALMNAFYGQNMRYIGVKIIVLGITYYGWISVAVASDANSFTVYEFAYQDIPNTPIKAGEKDTGIGIFENSLSERAFNIYPNPVSINENLHFNGDFESDLYVKFYDISGKEIIETKVSGGKLFLGDLKITKGFYFIRLFEREVYCGSKKILIE